MTRCGWALECRYEHPRSRHQGERRVQLRRVLILDALGAALSVMLLGAVLPALEAYLGMPVSVLYGLALWALCCLLYDVGCLALADLARPHWLTGVILLNSAYWFLSGALAIHHRHALTALGVAYFVGELCVIAGIVALEVRVLRRLRA